MQIQPALNGSQVIPVPARAKAKERQAFPLIVFDRAWGHAKEPGEIGLGEESWFGAGNFGRVGCELHGPKLSILGGPAREARVNAFPASNLHGLPEHAGSSRSRRPILRVKSLRNLAARQFQPGRIANHSAPAWAVTSAR